MTDVFTAGGYLYHAESGKVLLHHRDGDAPRFANMWSGFGGHSEEEDGGDPVTTWRREMREELGIALAPEQIVPLREGINPYTGRRRYIFYVLWPALNEDFVLTEGDGFAWFTLMDALALPDVQPLAHADLAILHAAASRTE